MAKNRLFLRVSGRLGGGNPQPTPVSERQRIKHLKEAEDENSFFSHYRIRMLTSATAMIFGARAYFFKQHRDALYRAWPGAGGRPWLVRGRGPWLRSGALGPGSVSIPALSPLDPRAIPARSPLDPRSIPAQLAPLLTLPVPVPVRVPVARSRSLGRSTLGWLALGRRRPRRRRHKIRT